MPDGGSTWTVEQESLSDVKRLKDVAEFFNKLGVEYPLDDGRGNGSAPDSEWKFADKPWCSYGNKILTYISENDPVKGRHYWLLNELCRLEAYRRYGCLTQELYDSAHALIEEKFLSFFADGSPWKHDNRDPKPDEVAHTHRDAIARIAAKDEAGLKREVHHPHYDTSGFDKISDRWRSQNKGGTGEQGNGGTTETDENRARIALLARTVLPIEFWESRDALRHIWASAKARLVSPEAVLAAVLQNVSSAVGPHLRMPAVPSRDGTLNYFVAIAGEPSVGKGAALEVARTCMIIQDAPIPVNIGTGEGLVKRYVTAHKKDGQVTYKRVSYTAIFEIAEASTFEALASRRGATITPELLKAWSGESLGFANADDERRLLLKAHDYRLGIVMGVQPGKASVLFNGSDIGFPHRFLYTSAYDANAIRERVDSPAPVVWNPPVGLSADITDVTEQAVYMTYPDSVSEALFNSRFDGLTGTVVTSDIEGHDDYIRAKTMCLLALLDGRLDVTEEDWSLSGQIMAYSKEVRAALQWMKQEAKNRKIDAEGFAEARKQDIVEHSKVHNAANRMARTVWRHAETNFHDDGECLRRCLKDAVGRKGTYSPSEAIEYALDKGWIHAIAVPGRGMSGHHYKLGNWISEEAHA